jgi:selenide,water dikinase
VFEAARLPVLPGARALAAAGHVTGGCQRIREWLAGKVDVAPDVPADLADVAWDPQTSGGLLAAVPASAAQAAVDALVAAGVAAAIVGRVEAREGGASVALV